MRKTNIVLGKRGADDDDEAAEEEEENLQDLSSLELLYRGQALQLTALHHQNDCFNRLFDKLDESNGLLSRLSSSNKQVGAASPRVRWCVSRCKHLGRPMNPLVA